MTSACIDFITTLWRFSHICLVYVLNTTPTKHDVLQLSVGQLTILYLMF